MNIALTADPLRPPLTGIGRYTLELARAIAHLREDDSHDLWLLGGELVEFKDWLREQVADRECLRESGRGRMGLRRIGRYIPYSGLVYRGLLAKRQRTMLKVQPMDVVHGTNFYLPDTSAARVVTIHDLSIISCPGHHPVERVRVLQRGIREAVSRADLIITDSCYVKTELCRELHVQHDRVKVVPLGVGEEFRPRDRSELESALDRFGLANIGYVLFVGTMEPRKNLGVLLEAYKTLPVELRRKHPLVLVGDKGWLSAELHVLIAELSAEGWLRYLGYVEDRLLPFLYAGATLFAYPSLYEGFGLPVLEAMAAGVPVVCSNSSSLPEVCGTAALTHSPRSVEDLRTQLMVALMDREWRAGASEAGLRQAAGFSWSRCAKETVSVYRQAIQASSRSS